MNAEKYNLLNEGDKGAILERIFSENTDLLFNEDTSFVAVSSEDRDEDYDYAQDIINASYVPFGFLADDIQTEILSGDYDYVLDEGKKLGD